VLPGLQTWMALRLMGGVLLVTSFIMFTYNVIATIVVRRPFELPDFTTMTEPVPTTAPIMVGGEAQ